MRVLVTGGAGFVGSNVVAAAAARGDDVVALVRALPPLPDPACRYVLADLLDEAATRAAVEDAGPDVIVHTAILNDFLGIYADRRRGVGQLRRRHAHARGRRERPRRRTAHRLDRLGLRRHAGGGGRGDAAEPDQLLRRAQGGERGRDARAGPGADRR